MPPNDTAPLNPAASTASTDLDVHLGVLAEAVREDDEHYEDTWPADAD